MENYGFVLMPKEQAEKIGLPNGSGLFDELYSHMMQEIERDANKIHDYGNASQMTTDEKWISFMNRYFVFNKVRNVDTEKIYNEFLRKSGKMEEMDELENILELKETKEEEKKEKPRVRKLKEKIVLDKYSPVEHDDDTQVAPLPKIIIGETVVIKKQKK
jgi:hypothetical protein